MLVVFQFAVTPSSYSQVGCGGQNVDTSCLKYPNQTYQCIDGDFNAPDLYNSQLLPPAQAQTTPQYLLVMGKVTFTEDYQFAPGSDIVFLDNTSGFRVGSPKKLTLSFTDLHGCTKLWAGVEVPSGATLFAHDCTFEDAKAAIILRGYSTFEITGNTFNKNVCGILGVDANPAIQNTPLFLASARGISGNTFLGGSMLLEPIHPETIDPGVANSAVQNVALNYPFAGIWIERVTALTIGHLKSLSVYPDLPLNSFQNFGNVQEYTPVATQNMGIRSIQSNLTVRNSTFSDIGFFNPFIPNSNVIAAGIYARSITSAIRQTTIIGTKEKVGQNTFSNCYEDIQTAGTHLTVTGVVSNKPALCINAIMANDWQNPIKVDVRDNNITSYLVNGIFVSHYKPIHLNIENNYISDNNELYGPDQRYGIYISGKGSALLNGSRIYNNQILSNSFRLNKAFVGIALNQSPYLIMENNNIYEKVPGQSNLGAFYGIFTVAPPSNGLRLYSNSINGAKIDYTYAAGIRIYESGNTVLNCNATDRTNAGIVFFGNCDNADISKNRFNYHNKGLSLGDPLYPNLQMNAVGLQTAKENRWFGANSPVEAFALNEESALASIFEINSSDLNSEYWPYPRKIGAADDMFTWFKPLQGQEPSNDFTCLTTETNPPCEPYPCEEFLADSDIQLLNGTYQPPLDYPALTWEARWHFADRLNRNVALQNSSPEAAQYFQDSFNASYSWLNRIYQDYRNCWQPGGSLASTVSDLSDSLQTLVGLRFTMDGQLSENWSENDSLHAQMADADVTIANVTDTLSGASQDLVSLVGQNVNALLLDLENVTCQEIYEQDMKDVIRTTLQTHFTEGILTGQQSSAMTTIAGKCRYSGGYAVVLARAFFEPQESYEQDAGCGLGQRSSIGSTDGDMDVTAIFYPNPASTSLTLHLERDFDAGTARIYSSQGVLLKSVDFHEKNVQFSVTDFNNGFYMIEILLDGKPALHKTFVKVD